MLTTGQLQNAAIVAMVVYRRFTRRRQRQYWLRPWISRWSLFLDLLHTIFKSRSDLFEHLLQNDAVMCKQVGDFVNPLPMIDACLETTATDRRLVCDRAPIDPRLIAFQAQARSPLHCEDPRPFHDETDRRTVGDRSATNIRPL